MITYLTALYSISIPLGYEFVGTCNILHNMFIKI